jgi:hypothetical protein
MFKPSIVQPLQALAPILSLTSPILPADVWSCPMAGFGRIVPSPPVAPVLAGAAIATALLIGAEALQRTPLPAHPLFWLALALGLTATLAVTLHPLLTPPVQSPRYPPARARA